MYTFHPKPIIGQEAICPHGLGRVVAFNNEHPHGWVQVQTYVNDRSCRWDFTNVTLVKIGESVPLQPWGTNQ